MSEEPTVQMRALAVHTYHDQRYEPGALYEADGVDVETLEALQFAERADTVSSRLAPEVK